MPSSCAGFERDDAYLASLEAGADAIAPEGDALVDAVDLDDDEGATWTTDNAAITERNIAMQQVGGNLYPAGQAGTCGRGVGRSSMLGLAHMRSSDLASLSTASLEYQGVGATKLQIKP